MSHSATLSVAYLTATMIGRTMQHIISTKTCKQSRTDVQYEHKIMVKNRHSSRRLAENALR